MLLISHLKPLSKPSVSFTLYSVTGARNACHPLSIYKFKACLCSVRDSELGRPGFDSLHGSHCVIEAGRMCKLMVAVTSGRLVH